MLMRLLRLVPPPGLLCRVLLVVPPLVLLLPPRSLRLLPLLGLALLLRLGRRLLLLLLLRAVALGGREVAVRRLLRVPQFLLFGVRIRGLLVEARSPYVAISPARLLVLQFLTLSLSLVLAMLVLLVAILSV